MSRPLTLALLAAVWFYLPYAVHFLAPAEGRSPTGFLQYDMSYYAANADAHFDRGFRPLIPNPSSDNPDAPGLYAFPQNWLFGAMLQLSPLSSGLTWTLLGFSAAVAMFLVSFRLLDAAHPALQPALHKAQNWGKFLLSLGGGVLFLSGFFVWGLSQARGENPPWNWVWTFDPAEGMWFFNLGRNAFYPYEALYHCLFLGSIAALFLRKWLWCCVLAGLAAWAHPFTGIELLSVLLTGKAIDLVGRDRGEVPWKVAGVWLALGIGMALYYFWILPMNTEHRDTAEGWKLDWTVEARTLWPAYALVLPPALLAVVREWKTAGRLCFRTRFLLGWALTVVLLMNHDWFIRPHQPIHFSRGYGWTALFLLGFPVLRGWIAALLKKPLALCAVSAVFCLDNAAFVLDFTFRRAPIEGTIRVEENAVRDALKRHMRGEDLLIVPEENAPLAILALGDNPGLAWFSHKFQTPYWEKKRALWREFVDGGEIPKAWKNRPLLVLSPRNQGESRSRSLESEGIVERLWEGETLCLFRLTPTGQTNP